MRLSSISNVNVQQNKSSVQFKGSVRNELPAIEKAIESFRDSKGTFGQKESKVLKDFYGYVEHILPLKAKLLPKSDAYAVSMDTRSGFDYIAPAIHVKYVPGKSSKAAGLKEKTVAFVDADCISNTAYNTNNYSQIATGKNQILKHILTIYPQRLLGFLGMNK